MTTVTRVAIVPYPCDKMCALVDNIEAYPEFIPWCVEAHVLQREASTVVATLTVGKGKVRHSFTTQNQNHAPHLIELKLKEGPFSHFYAKWEFKALGEKGSQIAFHIEFELNHKLLDAAFGAMLHHMANTMVKAFCDRAKQIYDKPS